MSPGMAAKVQTKTYFHGSMIDLNNGLCNVMWDPYHDDRNQGYNFLMSQTMDGYPRYPKEQMRQTILKQESIFKHQLQELHRLYKRQRDLMNEVRMKDHYSFTIPAKASNSGHFLSQVCSQRGVIDLELPADVEGDREDNLSTKKAYNLADLNEPIQMEEATFAASFINRNRFYGVTDAIQKQDLSTNSKFWYLQDVPKKPHEHVSKKKTIFGVELCENSHKSPFDSSQSSSWDQNPSSLNHNHWFEQHEAFNGKKNLEKQLPHWLTNTKGKETILYQMNLDSLQQQSHQFFKKTEKLQTDNVHGVTKILGVPIQDSTIHTHDTNVEVDKNARNNSNLESKNDIDLNLSFDEEEDLSAKPNITVEIDLEAPAALEAETYDVCMDADDQELVKSAAEAIMVISSCEPPPDDTLLQWFAEVIASGECDGEKTVNVNKKDEDGIPEGMDYFEYMTLNLQETEVDNDCYKAVVVVEKEDDGLLRKQVTRKGQGKRGRQRKDFQRDVLPGIVSLSRREVTEDLQTFEEAFNGIGVSWQSKRKAGRGRRQLAALSCQMSPPPPSPPEVAVAVEQSVCREVALEEKSLSGWGKRTRRLPRQRCQNGSNHQSFALKC